jgi:hypothetical protein
MSGLGAAAMLKSYDPSPHITNHYKASWTIGNLPYEESLESAPAHFEAATFPQFPVNLPFPPAAAFQIVAPIISDLLLENKEYTLAIDAISRDITLHGLNIPIVGEQPITRETIAEAFYMTNYDMALSHKIKTNNLAEKVVTSDMLSKQGNSLWDNPDGSLFHELTQKADVSGNFFAQSIAELNIVAKAPKTMGGFDLPLALVENGAEQIISFGFDMKYSRKLEVSKGNTIKYSFTPTGSSKVIPGPIPTEAPKEDGTLNWGIGLFADTDIVDLTSLLKLEKENTHIPRISDVHATNYDNNTSYFKVNDISMDAIVTLSEAHFSDPKTHVFNQSLQGYFNDPVNLRSELEETKYYDLFNLAPGPYVATFHMQINMNTVFVEWTNYEIEMENTEINGEETNHSDPLGNTMTVYTSSNNYIDASFIDLGKKLVVQLQSSPAVIDAVNDDTSFYLKTTWATSSEKDSVSRIYSKNELTVTDKANHTPITDVLDNSGDLVQVFVDPSDNRSFLDSGSLTPNSSGRKTGFQHIISIPLDWQSREEKVTGYSVLVELYDGETRLLAATASYIYMPAAPINTTSTAKENGEVVVEVSEVINNYTSSTTDTTNHVLSDLVPESHSFSYCYPSTFDAAIAGYIDDKDLWNVFDNQTAQSSSSTNDVSINTFTYTYKPPTVGTTIGVKRNAVVYTYKGLSPTYPATATFAAKELGEINVIKNDSTDYISYRKNTTTSAGEADTKYDFDLIGFFKEGDGASLSVVGLLPFTGRKYLDNIEAKLQTWGLVFNQNGFWSCDNWQLFRTNPALLQPQLSKKLTLNCALTQWKDMTEVQFTMVAQFADSYMYPTGTTDNVLMLSANGETTEYMATGVQGGSLTQGFTSIDTSTGDASRNYLKEITGGASSFSSIDLSGDTYSWDTDGLLLGRYNESTAVITLYDGQGGLLSLNNMSHNPNRTQKTISDKFMNSLP